MRYIEQGSRNYRKALACMLLGSLVTFATLYSPQTLLSVFSEHYRVAPSTASFTIALTTAALALGMLFVPLFSNAWGRKRMMSLSLFLTSALAILSSFGDSFGFLLAIRLLEGFSLAGFPATAMAYLGEEFSPRSIGGIMGIYVAGTGIGGFVGRVVVGTLTDLFSWRAALLGLGAINLLCSLYFWFNLPESRHFKPAATGWARWRGNLRDGLRNPNLLSLYGTGFLLMGAYVALLNYIGYPLRQAPYRLNQTMLGSLFAVNLLGIWSAVLFGRLADRHPRPLVIGSAIGLLLAGALLTLHGALWVKIIGLTVFVFGFFAGHSVASGWVGVTAPAGIKAQASSLYLLFYYAGSSLIGWSGGFCWARFGWGGLIGLIGVLLGMAVLLILRVAALPALARREAPKPSAARC